MQNSIKPYLLRALYEWCTENRYTPYIAVKVDNSTRVPRQFAHDDKIILNISFNATTQLKMGNELIEFIARFSGRAYKIEIPISNVLEIYARENRYGISFKNIIDSTISNSNYELLIGDKIEKNNCTRSNMFTLSSEIHLNSDNNLDDNNPSSKLNNDKKVVNIKRSRSHLKLVK